MERKIVVITGMSGAGRSRAADWFEDQGYYCVDNNRIEKMVFVTDLRSRSFFDNLEGVIDGLRADPTIDLTVLFMEAAPREIVKRYNEVRRNHPLTGAEASWTVIEEEAEKLKDIRKKSDIILDTTNLKVSELHSELDKLFFGGSGSSNFAINISSFGFKYGIPNEADVMFDVRFIPNPYYVPSLKKLSGNNKKVAEYIFRHEIANQFVDSVHILLRSMVPGYINEGKYHLNIAFGCTGGHHRSVAVANAVAAKFEADGMRVKIRHRDMELQNRKK